MNLIDNLGLDNFNFIIRIYQKVLLQMFTDLISASKHQSYNSYRQQAFDWFFCDKYKNDFSTVCEIAGFNPENIRKKAKNMLEKSGGLFQSQTTDKQ